jgi:hypothetical protein
LKKKFEKKFEKKFAKKVQKYYKLSEGGREGGREGRGGEGGREGGRRIVIPMPEAINEVDGRRQLLTSDNEKERNVRLSRTIIKVD